VPQGTAGAAPLGLALVVEAQGLRLEVPPAPGRSRRNPGCAGRRQRRPAPR
jgi:hypothetical protein